jgi:hypothetical protein
MGFFRYLLDVFSGRIAHWNETGSKLFSELNKKLKSIENPDGFILRHFLESVYMLIGSLLLSRDDFEGKIDIDVKQIGHEQVHQLYHVLLGYFICVYYTTNPSFKEGLKKSLTDIMGEPTTTEDLLHAFGSIGIRSGIKGDKGRIDMLPIGTEVWLKVADILGVENRKDGALLILFSIVCLNHYKVAVELINMELMQLIEKKPNLP